jgi:F-type H+-transporting ATPase subunit b
MEKLGINPILIAVQIINFALLLFLLKRVLYKPVLKAIKDRELKLTSIDKEKKDILEERKKFEEEKLSSKRLIQNDKKKMLDDAKREAEKRAKAIIEEANKKGKDIIHQADLEAERQIKKDRVDLNKKALEISFAMIKKASKNLLSEKSQKESVDFAIKKLAKINGK